MTEELSVFVEGRMMGCLLWDRRRDRLMQGFGSDHPHFETGDRGV
jgi:hypothetical protein